MSHTTRFCRDRLVYNIEKLDSEIHEVLETNYNTPVAQVEKFSKQAYLDFTEVEATTHSPANMTLLGDFGIGFERKVANESLELVILATLCLCRKWKRTVALYVVDTEMAGSVLPIRLTRNQLMLPDITLLSL